VAVSLGVATTGAGTETTIINENSARDSVRIRTLMVIPLLWKPMPQTVSSEKSSVNKSGGNSF
jgi:hypothetical protein